MKAKVYDLEGKIANEIELADEVFACKISNGSIYYAIKSELANRRQGTACTKTRKEVNGSNIKPWRQKGTGRARAGDRKSPVWVGGGTVFGPRPRDYSIHLPKKQKRMALKSILSLKLKEERLKIIKDFNFDSGKTKDLVGLLKNLAKEENTVFIVKGDNKLLFRAGANIPWLRLQAYNRLTAHELFYSQKVLVCESAAKNLNEFYGAKA